MPQRFRCRLGRPSDRGQLREQSERSDGGVSGIFTGGSFGINGNVVTVDLLGGANAQTLTVILDSVTDGVNVGTVVISMGVLLGDVNGDSFVLSGDYTAVRQKSGSAVDGNTFKFDINFGGFILGGDYTTVRQQSGSHLSPTKVEPSVKLISL